MDQIIIIGSSAAGLSAAIYCARRGIMPRVVGFDAGGEMLLSGEIGNYPGAGLTDGWKLTEQFVNQARTYGIIPEIGIKVRAIGVFDNGFIVRAEQDNQSLEYQAKTVIIATGGHPRELNVPGEKEFRGKGVSYCTVCDGPVFKGKTTATIGGGDSANESGIMLSDIADRVYVITKNQDMKGDVSLIKRLKNCQRVTMIYNALTTKIIGGKFVEAVEYKDQTTGELRQIKTDGVFIHIGLIPNSDFCPPELKRNARGEIIVDKIMATSMPGVFAAGDVTDTPYKQIGVAVGQGIAAALSCFDYLNKH
jgi:alkyl hydroperoxide reductase subunit AhpF